MPLGCRKSLRLEGGDMKAKSEKRRKSSRREFLRNVAAAGASAAVLSQAACVTAPAKRAPTVRAKARKGLNLIVIIADTWRADHLGCYGNKRVKTPNLDEFASQAVLFESCYADGLPTIPARRVYFTGKSILPDSLWCPLAQDVVTLARVLKKHKYTTGFIADTYHYFKPNMNFHRGFDSWQWIRGQETDRWRSGPKAGFDPAKHIPAHLRNPRYDANMLQYWMNTLDRKKEEDYACARTCRAAMRWLEENASNRPFMLWIDTFDPHEPWDAPRRFQKMYYDRYPFERTLFGYGVRNRDIRADDLPWIKALYAAEVSFTDMWIGRLIEHIDRMGLRDDTIVVFSTDHGTHLGEEGFVQKHAELLNSCVARLPLIIRHPDRRFAGKRVGQLVSAIDYMPTFLSLLGITDHRGMDGLSMWPLVTGERTQLRERVFIGFKKFGAVRDRRWHYFQNIKGKARGKGPALYDLTADPGETRNVIAEHPDVAERMRSLMEERLKIKLPPIAV